MTRHTPDFLRARSSNLSLRSVAMEQSSFLIPKPDDHVVGQMFQTLVQRRGWDKLPSDALRQMMAYPPSKKWMLVCQDLMTGTAGAANPTNNTAHAKDLKPEDFTKPYLEFMTENPTVFHAVDYFKEKLAKSGYEEVRILTPLIHSAIANHDSRSSQAVTVGAESSSPVESTSPPAMAAPSLPSPSARPTSPAMVSP